MKQSDFPQKHKILLYNFVKRKILDSNDRPLVMGTAGSDNMISNIQDRPIKIQYNDLSPAEH